jgi:hypothetical protein
MFFLMSHRNGFGRAFVGTAMGATVYAIPFTLWLRSAKRRRIRRRYARDPVLVSPPPVGRWDARFQVTLLDAGRFGRGIAGDLYVAPDRLQFVPVLDTPERHRKPISVPLGKTPHVDVIERPEDWLTNLLLPASPRYVEIWNGQRSLLLRVPEPDKVAESLREYWQQVAIHMH